MKKATTDRMYEQIHRHGKVLIRVFGLPAETDPVTLCKSLRRWEVKAHRWAEDWCNGKISPTDAEVDAFETQLLCSVRKVLGQAPVPIVFNTDPRGYALKIPDAWMYEHAEAREMQRDMGGYGIICPEFTGKE
jgi:hypothetical protein